MKNLKIKPYRILGFCSMILLSVASIGWSVEYHLRADVTTVMMPGGPVTMWGFALDSAFGVEDGIVTVPGPVLRVPPGDTTLTVHLKNNLTPATTGIPTGCPASVVIPGQITALSPVRFGPAPYPEFEGRIRNVTYDTPPGNVAPVDYTWTNLKPGSYTYFSGNHLACHVQMGLYGAMIKDAAVGQAYPGVSYDNEVILFYSEIDPTFHTAVATLNYGPGKAITSTMEYNPQYYLVNGQPYQAGQSPLPAGQIHEQTLIRFFNMGLETHVPVFQNLRATVLAEDGYPYPYPKDQSSILLTAGKTVDAIVVPKANGLYPVYDRRLRLTNQKASPGGQLAYLEVGSLAGNAAPVIVSVTATPSMLFDTQTSQLFVDATDSDGPAPLTYAWTVPAGAGSVSNAAIANPIYTPPDVATIQIYTLGVQVSDGQDVVSGSVNVTVYDSVILSADFDASAQGFVYVDDTFRGTNQPSYASGGFSAGYLRVSIGGINTVDVTGMSGGWRRTFTVPPASGSVQLSVRYLMTQSPGFEPSEYSDVLVSVDGVLVGTGANDYVARIVGDGDGGLFLGTGLQWFHKELGALAPGEHTLIIGGFVNHKDAVDESAGYRFEDVILTVTGPAVNMAPQISAVSATPAAILDTQTSQLLVVATDTDGPSPLSYNWTVPIGGGSVSNATIANPIYTPPDVASTQIITLSVEVSDGQDTASANLMITVDNTPVVNTPPVIVSVTATPSMLFDTQTSQLFVDATDSDGPAPLTYAWTVPAGAGSVSNAAIANPIYTPPDVATIQIYTLGVQVSDGQDVVSGSVNVTVYDSVILSADFDASAQGFVYVDDTFRGTNQPSYASGGFSAGYLRVSIGGINTVDVTGMSGGWRRTFTVPPASGSVQLSVRYLMTQSPGFEPSEYSDVLVSVDGVLVGTGANDYVARIVGDGDGGLFLGTGLQWFHKELGALAPGEHTLIIGGFVNHKDAVDESAGYRFEDVILSVAGI